jgi:hypothetical protein
VDHLVAFNEFINPLIQRDRGFKARGFDALVGANAAEITRTFMALITKAGVI